MSKDLTNLNWATFKLNGILPIVTSGMFYPEFDFSGKKLQSLDAPIGSLSFLAFNVTTIKNCSYAIFAWLDGKNQSKLFVNSLCKLDADMMSSAILQFCFDTSDNIFARPSWWKDLQPSHKSALSNLLRESTPGQKSPEGLKPLSSNLSELKVLEIRKSW